MGERGSRFKSMTQGQAIFDQQYQVCAGKFRRYNGESWVQRLLDVKTNFLNLRDAVFVVLGVIESWFLLRKLRPDVILLKGGFVGVPIGLAARKTVPIVTHDSDAVPGLANRLVSRWAVVHATGMPAEYYQYPEGKIEHVGVLVSDNYRHVTKSLSDKYRKQLDLPLDAEILMITGGSLGSQVINKAVAAMVPSLLQSNPLLRVIHQVGRGNTEVYNGFSNDRLEVHDLIPYDDLYKYTGAADVIITRAGANTMAEFGLQGKACIVVPNPLLTGGHQLKNAAFLAQRQAAVILEENELSSELATSVVSLLENAGQRQKLGQQLHDITIPNAAQKLAKILIKVAKSRGE